MWRLLGVLIAVVALGTLTMSHGKASAGPGQDKVLLCHVSDDARAHIIEVTEPAVPAHLDHGDCILTSTDRGLIGQECNPTDGNNNDICDVQP